MPRCASSLAAAPHAFDHAYFVLSFIVMTLCFYIFRCEDKAAAKLASGIPIYRVMVPRPNEEFTWRETV